jgi:hypothetical protein
VRRNGVPKVEARDMAVLPKVAVLVNSIVNTVQVSDGVFIVRCLGTNLSV